MYYISPLNNFFFLAVALFDRLFWVAEEKISGDQRYLRLAGACILIASKFEEGSEMHASVEDIVTAGKNKFTCESLRNAENFVLMSIQWSIGNNVTSIEFIRYCMQEKQDIPEQMSKQVKQVKRLAMAIADTLLIHYDTTCMVEPWVIADKCIEIANEHLAGEKSANEHLTGEKSAKTEKRGKQLTDLIRDHIMDCANDKKQKKMMKGLFNKTNFL